MNTIVLKIALSLHNADRLTTLMDGSVPEKEEILSILGFVSNEVTINGICATADGLVAPSADTGVILDARIENRKEFNVSSEVVDD
jgi:hypothetical protein